MILYQISNMNKYMIYVLILILILSSNWDCSNPQKDAESCVSKMV